MKIPLAQRVFRCVALIFWALPAFPLTVTGQVQVDVVRLSDRAAVFRARTPQPTNVIALAAEEGMVVIDTEVSSAFAGPIRRKIEETFGRSDFAYVINTHHHGDHTWGNQVFADATLVGMENIPAGMEEREESRLQTAEQLGSGLPRMRETLEGMDPDSEEGRALAGTISYYEGLLSGIGGEFRLTLPTLTFNDRMTLRLGDLTLEAVYFGRAHSESDVLVFCPEEELIATGDLFAPGADPYIDSERVPHLDRWLANMDSILGGAFQPDFIVPGHGDLLSPEDVSTARDRVREIRLELEGRASAFFAFKEAFEEGGLEPGLASMDELHARQAEYYFFHPEFDSFVYRLMLNEDLERTVPLFEKLAALFPDVPNAHDSLGEAYLRIGEKEKARLAFQRCLDLDPEHRNARTRLQELAGGK